jgi:hypothetical protein
MEGIFNTTKCSLQRTYEESLCIPARSTLPGLLCVGARSKSMTFKFVKTKSAAEEAPSALTVAGITNSCCVALCLCPHH